jgi:vacuolar-type H+-ATPase subunit F/Vma7
LKEKLNKSDYKVILFDKEISSTSPDEMATLIGNTPAIMFVDSMSETDEKDKALFNNVLSNVINKQQLEELIQKFI